MAFPLVGGGCAGLNNKGKLRCLGGRGSDPAGFVLDGTAGGFENLFGGGRGGG